MRRLRLALLRCVTTLDRKVFVNVAPVPHFANCYLRAGLHRREGVYRIANWYWELETAPANGPTSHPMIESVLDEFFKTEFDFREFANPSDPLSSLFEEWIPYYRLKFCIAKALQPQSILEVGVRFGYSARTFRRGQSLRAPSRDRSGLRPIRRPGRSAGLGAPDHRQSQRSVRGWRQSKNEAIPGRDLRSHPRRRPAGRYRKLSRFKARSFPRSVGSPRRLFLDAPELFQRQ